MPRDRAPLPESGIYRTILWVMVITVIAGGLLAIAGENIYRDPALVHLGTWVALIGGALYAFFRVLGAREARRRARKHDSDG